MKCISGTSARITDVVVFLIPEEDGVGGDDESMEIGTNGAGDGSGWASGEGAGAGEDVVGCGELAGSFVFDGAASGSGDTSIGSGEGIRGEGDGTGDAIGDGSTGTLDGGDGVAVPAGAHAATSIMTY